jgi:alkanesulfonate monooxygenase SsuD/methylene tetrahydromethanopterin reductase-like flavin-dependent oxidoreductase (luciferase family)
MIPGIGINLPQDTGTIGDDGGLLRTFVAEAEAEGYSSLWVLESSVPGALDPLSVLSFAAAMSTRARIGVAILLTAFRPPLQLAREIASLDRLSGGRCIVGVGLGNDRDQYARYGISVDHRGRHFEAGTALLRRLLAEDRVTSMEPWWELDDVARPLAPVQSPTPPIWYGARQPAALDRAVRLGDGFIGAGSMSLADFEIAVGRVRELLEVHGRDAAGFTLAKRVYLHVGEPTTAAMDAVRGWFEHEYGRPQLADDCAIVGPADVIAEHLARLRAHGVRELVLHPVVDLAEQRARLTRDVLPLLA